MAQLSFLWDVENKVVMFVVVYMVRNSTRTLSKGLTPRYICVVQWHVGHVKKDITWCGLWEIKFHRLTRTLTGKTDRQGQFISVL